MSSYAPAPTPASPAFTSVRLGDGAVGAPSVAFADDTDTGFYSPANGQIGITVDGVAAALIFAAAMFFSGTMSGPGGTVGGPTYASNGDATTGLWFPGAGIASVTGAGVEVARFSTVAGAPRVGLYGAAPVARAAAIATPTAPSAGYVQAEAAAMKTAVDAIRAALTAIGITL